MSLKDYIGKTLKPWPNFIDHYNSALENILDSKLEMLGYTVMLKGYVNVDSYECILCGNRMYYANFRSGTPLSKLTFHAIISSKVKSASGCSPSTCTFHIDFAEK